MTEGGSKLDGIPAATPDKPVAADVTVPSVNAPVPRVVAPKSQPSLGRLLGEQIGVVLIAVSAVLAATGYLKHTSEERVRTHVIREKERMDDFLLPLRYYLSIDACEEVAADDLKPLTLSKSAREAACIVKEASALDIDKISAELNLHLHKKLFAKDQFLSEGTIELLTKVTALNERAHRALSALQPRTRRVEFLLRRLETNMNITDRLTLIRYRDEIVTEEYRLELWKEIDAILAESRKELSIAETMPAAHWNGVVGAPKK